MGTGAAPFERATGRRPPDAEIAEETDRLVHRDAQDATQTTQARDAILIDTTSLTQDEQVARIVALLEAAAAADGGRSRLSRASVCAAGPVLTKTGFTICCRPAPSP